MLKRMTFTLTVMCSLTGLYWLYALAVTPRLAPPMRMVAKRLPFMPTSQSARLRPRAASARPSYSWPARRRRKPSRIASGVSDEIQSRFTGFVQPAAS